MNFPVDLTDQPYLYFWHQQTMNTPLAQSISRLYFKNACDERLLLPSYILLYSWLVLIMTTFQIQSQTLPF